VDPHDAVTFKVQKELLSASLGSLQNGARNQLGTVVKPTLRGRRHHALTLKNVAKQPRNPVNGVTLRHG